MSLPRASRHAAATRAPLVGVALFLVGVAVLARTQAYYGGLLRGWDAQFYYAAARSIALDGDLDVTNDLQAAPHSAPFDRDGDGSLEMVPRAPSGRIVSIYPIGLSLIEAPFLVLGHGLRGALAMFDLSWPEPPGFSAVEIWAVALGLLAVFAIGGQLLDAILRPHVGSPWRQLALFATWWGTSLLFYSAVFPFMAHAVGFTLVVWIVWLGWRIGAGICATNRLWLLGVALGALYLVRQQQMVIVLPLLLVLAPLRGRPARTWSGWGAAGLATALALVAVQAWVHSRLGNSWQDDAWRLARFDWLHPDLWTVLLSPARGLLSMNPVVLLAAGGFLATPLRQLPRPFAVFAVLAVLQMYLIACWPYPHQGDAFGSRMWVECTGAVACGVALLYRRTALAGRLLISAALLVCVAWTTRLLILYVTGHLPLIPPP